MKVSIICPLYNAEDYVEDLYKMILEQENVDIVEIKFIVTESDDNTEEILKKLGLTYKKIKRDNFSHSIIREEEAVSSIGEIIVFITQDIRIANKFWLYKLIEEIQIGNCQASFSRQIAYENHTVEKYTREINYPKESRTVSKSDIDELGLMTFFFSDASSAILKQTFIDLNGYDGKDLPTNEDMYIAHKLIMNNYKIKYVADSQVIHSHELSFKQTFSRYKDIGMFFKENSYFDNFNANERGIYVLVYIFKRLYEEKKLYLVPKIIWNFVARFLGMKIGKFKDYRREKEYEGNNISRGIRNETISSNESYVKANGSNI
ncbi:glycosyltransferase family 2 protein [Clostridium sp.]|uniref:glycosyltransferase n=1 Tax=Clostridium sp. TaxID=1506 RepID=UPI00290ACE42|nr:glycosyltransferase family 2 protein [Clostridium sp.]MDU7241732.1 glycosyltransferase family 2 protein [Clostridium sp.]